MTCGRAQEFLAQHRVDVAAVADAKKDRLGPKQALQLAREARKIVVAKGKKVVTLDMKKDAPKDADLLKLLLGPSGNLRAPTLQKSTLHTSSSDCTLTSSIPFCPAIRRSLDPGRMHRRKPIFSASRTRISA